MWGALKWLIPELLAFNPMTTRAAEPTVLALAARTSPNLMTLSNLYAGRNGHGLVTCSKAPGEPFRASHGRHWAGLDYPPLGLLVPGRTFARSSHSDCPESF